MRAQPCRPTRTHAIVDQIVGRAGAESLLPVLQQVQASIGYLDSGALGAASDKLRTTDARTYGVASFYSMLATQPRTKNVIRICDGPVCQLFGCQQLRQSITAALPTGQCIVERTGCLGLCDRAPALLVNLEPCGPASCDKAGAILDGWRGFVPSYAQPRSGEIRIALARLGHIDPADRRRQPANIAGGCVPHCWAHVHRSPKRHTLGALFCKRRAHSLSPQAVCRELEAMHACPMAVQVARNLGTSNWAVFC